jgi:AAA+ ATPase superfamily predicted ATPase
VSASRRVRNPFTYGDLVSDEQFTDRADELDQLKADLRNGQNVAVIAPRRYGKSSLVKAVLSDLLAEGILVVEVDLMTTPTKERFAAKLAKSIHDDVASVVFKAKERLRIFTSLRVSPSMTVDTDGSVSFSFAASRSPADIDETIERLLELPAEIAGDENRQVVVSFDEFQEVTDIDPHLPALMRAVFQKQQNVAHVYAGSKRDMMRRLFNDENEPFYRSAKTMEIGPIPTLLFGEFVKAQFDRTDRGLSDEALDRLLAITRGHPYATQELAYALWEEVPTGFSATVSDLDDALRAVLRSENARFTLVWENATRPQKLLLEALAREPGRPFSNPYRLRHDLPPTSGVQRALRPLLESELVRKEQDGAYDLAEPFLREWILTYAS